jgi:hypothetical protein
VIVGQKVILNEKGAKYCRKHLKLRDVKAGEPAEVVWVSKNDQPFVEVKFERWSIRNMEHPWGTWMLDKGEVDET